MPKKTAVGAGDSRVDKALELIKQMDPSELRALNEVYCAEFGLSLTFGNQTDTTSGGSS